VKVGGVGAEGIMMLPKVGELVRDWRMIACIALSVLLLDLEVPPPANACCGSILIFEEGPSFEGPPFVCKPV